MKLDSGLLIRAVSGGEDFGETSGVYADISVDRPLYYTGGEIEEGRIYIAKAADYDENTQVPDSSFLLLSADSEKKLTINSHNVFEVKNQPDVHQLFNQVQSVFDRYDKWDMALQKLMREGGGFQEMLDISQPVFRNPIILLSANFFVVAYSSLIDEMEQLNYLVEPDMLFDFSNILKTDPSFKEVRDYRRTFLFPEDVLGDEALCMNIFEHNTFAYRVLIPSVLDPVRQEDHRLLAHFTGYIEEIVKRNKRTDKIRDYSLERLLTRILKKDIRDYAVLEQEMSAFGWLESHTYCSMELHVTSLDLQNFTIDMLCDRFEKQIPHACAFQYQGYIAVFINLTRNGSDMERMMGQAVYFLRDNFLKAGVSNTAEGLLNLGYLYRQARIALEVGSRRKNYLWVHRFNDMALYYMLECCSGDIPKQFVCAKGLLLLKEYDKEHGSEYYHTLQVYLENYQNAVKSARELYIHRSTFLYRLDRIKEITGIEWNDRDMLLYWKLSYRIMELGEPMSLGEIEVH